MILGKAEEVMTRERTLHKEKNKDTLEGRRGEYPNQLWAIRRLQAFLSYLENNCIFFSGNITEKTYFVQDCEILHNGRCNEKYITRYIKLPCQQH